MAEAKKKEAKVIIEIGVETGEIRITNVGGEKKVGELPVDIKGIVDFPPLTILQAKSSPG